MIQNWNKWNYLYFENMCSNNIWTPLFVRLRFFNQMEDELQSHQHEEQWLRDKGNQLAQRDAELAGEVLREISLLETTWEDTKKLITERY